MLRAIQKFLWDLVAAAWTPFDSGGFEMHHWRIELQYRPSKTGPVIARATLTVSMTERRLIDNFRRLKQKAAPLLIREVAHQLICNGVVEVEPKCYLGEW